MLNSEYHFQNLLDSAPDAIVIVDQDGQINLVNHQTEKLFGYSRDELLRQPVDMLVPESVRARHKEHRRNYLAEPLTRPMGQKKDLYGLRKDGTLFPVEISLSSLATDEGLLVTGIIRDISDRIEAEQARQHMQVRYRELVDNLPVGVFRKLPDEHGRFLEVNPAMVAIFEAESAEQLLTHSFSEFYLDPETRAAFTEKTILHGHVNDEEVILKTLKGRRFHAALSAKKAEDTQGNIYFDGIVDDISARKEIESQVNHLNTNLRNRTAELETVNEELEAFAYSVSHDLRAPLRAIDGFSRTLVSEYLEILDEKGKDRLNRIRRATQRMDALIEDLLKLSRVTRAELKREPVDISAIASDILAALCRDKPQRFVNYRVEDGLTANCDARLIRVAMENLLSNAWKFTGQRADAVIEVGGRSNGKGFIYSVKDNGAGFDMNYKEKLFGTFERLHDATGFPGSGIGLATVRRIIHKHGGRIWAEGAVDHGAAFYFTLSEELNG